MIRPFFLSMIVAASVLCSGGCHLDSAQRITLLETAVGQAQRAADVAGAQVATLQSQLAAARQAGADSALLATIRARLDDALAVQPQADAFLSSARESLAKAKANPTWQGEVELYASLLVSAFGIGATAWFRRRAGLASARVTTQRDAMGSIVAAVESLPPDVQASVKAAVGQQMARDSTANGVIDSIKRAS